MPRPNSEGRRLMLVTQKAGRKCCPATKKEAIECICSSCVTCPLTFAPSTSYTVTPGYIIRKISSDPNAALVSQQSYSYQNVKLSLTYTVDTSIPEVFMALSRTSSYAGAVYMLIIDSNGITLEIVGTSLSIIVGADSSSTPYWTDGKVINITLTTMPGPNVGETRINLDIDNGDQTGVISTQLQLFFPPICGFYTIAKFPSIDTVLKLNSFGIARPCV